MLGAVRRIRYPSPSSESRGKGGTVTSPLDDEDADEVGVMNNVALKSVHSVVRDRRAAGSTDTVM